MGAITGSVPVAGFIAPTDDTDTYPAIDPIWGIDGHRSVADAATRNAIPDGRRRYGMEVFTQDNAKLWRLNDSPWDGTDGDWTEVTGGGGGSLTIGDPVSGGNPNSVLFEDAAENLAVAGDAFTYIDDPGFLHLGPDPANDWTGREISIEIRRQSASTTDYVREIDITSNVGDFDSGEVDGIQMNLSTAGVGATQDIFGIRGLTMNLSSQLPTGRTADSIYGLILSGGAFGGGTLSQCLALDIGIGCSGTDGTTIPIATAINIAIGQTADTHDTSGVSTGVRFAFTGESLSYALYADEMVTTKAYLAWWNNNGVYAIHAEPYLGGPTQQAVAALYNPALAKFVHGDADWERVIAGRWDANVAEIGTEKGGTGTYRPLRVLGSPVSIPEKATVGPLQSTLPGNLTNYFGSSVQATICSTANSYALGVATTQSTALFVAVESASGIEIDQFTSSGDAVCTEIYPVVNASSTVGAVVGIFVDGEIEASSTVTSYTGFQVEELGILNASTLTTFKGFDVISPVRAGTGAITTAIGVNVGNMAVTGVSTAYAVKTGTGLVELGDKLKTKDKIYPGTDAAATQTAAGIYAGTGAPNNSNGSNGDFYLRSDGGTLTTIYQRRSGTWTGVV